MHFATLLQRPSSSSSSRAMAMARRGEGDGSRKRSRARVNRRSMKKADASSRDFPRAFGLCGTSRKASFPDGLQSLSFLFLVQSQLTDDREEVTRKETRTFLHNRTQDRGSDAPSRTETQTQPPEHPKDDDRRRLGESRALPSFFGAKETRGRARNRLRRIGRRPRGCWDPRDRTARKGMTPVINRPAVGPKDEKSVAR